MRNKPWKNTQTAIELTSLLDVIFIVLMIVVCNQQITTKNQMDQAAVAITQAEAKEQAADARVTNVKQLESDAQAMMDEALAMKAEAEEIIAEKDFYAEQLNTYDTMANQIMAVTVYVDYEPSNLKERKIRILAGTKELNPISLNPSNQEEAWKEFERQMGTVLQENKDIPVILAVNKSQILYRDEKKVTEILEKLSGSHSNLYRKAEA